MSLACIGLGAACTFNGVPSPSVATPTLAGDETAEPTASPSPTLSASTATLSAPTPPPALESPTMTFTPGPPTQTFTPSPTPGPYEHVIEAGDTFYYIVQQPPYLYSDVSQNFINQFFEINPLIQNIDRLPPIGSTILIPRQTATPIPEGYALTLAVNPGLGAQFQAQVPAEIIVTQVAVREGQTILELAAQSGSTLVILATLNPQLGFYNCNFNNPSGGPECNVPLSIDDLINVPAFTPTPTLSPTFSGSETPTSIPTYAPPSLVFPYQSAAASARTFQLQWVSVGILQPEQVYFVQVEDTTSGTTFNEVTRSTSYDLPETLIPADGQPHIMRWRVSVAEPNEQNAYRIVSGDSPWRTFTWQSR